MKQINNVAKCPFCQGEFKIEKDDIKVEKIQKGGYGYFECYKYIKCPVCEEYIARTFMGTSPK